MSDRVLLLRAEGVELSFGDRHVLSGATLSAWHGDRIGLVGPNGCGKSTFLKVMAGIEPPDSGGVFSQGVVAALEQDPELPFETVGEAARAALRWHAELLAAWQRAHDEGALGDAARHHDRLDLVGWTVEHRVEAMLTRLGAPPDDARIERLSGGERRRVSLVRALLRSPEVLLLDEPTNHLDADAISWLESFLMGYPGAVVLVTHDRYLLEAVATRVVEMERGEAVSYEGSYADYLITRAERRAAMEKADGRRLALLAREAEWASRSPSARTTKQQARLDRLEALQQVPALTRDASFSLDLSTGARMGSTLLEARGLTKSLGGRLLLNGVDLVLRPGERIGVLGPNGIGKSTLLRMISGTLEPDAGEISRGPRVKVSVLDQARTGLDDDALVIDAAADGAREVKLGDDWVGVQAFLQRMLFTREHFTQRVDGLSGGERARLLLARLLLRGSQVLMLDEPTNDLDLLTLRVLEEALLAFDGAALIVTHDRAFLDRVCTSVLLFEGNGVVTTYADRFQALAASRRAAADEAEQREAAVAVSSTPSVAPSRAPRAKRISYKQKQELAALPAAIEALEAEVAALEGVMADPETYRSRADEVPALAARLQALPAEVEVLYARWEELEALAEVG